MKVTLGSPCLLPGHHQEEEVLFSHLCFSRSCFCELVESNQGKNRTLCPGGGISHGTCGLGSPIDHSPSVGRTGGQDLLFFQG